MPGAHRVCPWWIGYLLVSPVRRLLEPPERLLQPYVRPGMTVVEPGCGMGYFTLPLARLVGPTGRVVCVDLQEKMIGGLLRRARRAGLEEQIVASVCSPEDLGLGRFRASADLAVAIHMVHEVPDQARLLTQLSHALKSGGRLLIKEPKGHVTPEAFARTLAVARQAGLTASEGAASGRGLTAVLRKN